MAVNAYLSESLVILRAIAGNASRDKQREIADRIDLIISELRAATSDRS